MRGLTGERSTPPTCASPVRSELVAAFDHQRFTPDVWHALGEKMGQLSQPLPRDGARRRQAHAARLQLRERRRTRRSSRPTTRATRCTALLAADTLHRRRAVVHLRPGRPRPRRSPSRSSQTDLARPALPVPVRDAVPHRPGRMEFQTTLDDFDERLPRDLRRAASSHVEVRRRRHRSRRAGISGHAHERRHLAVPHAGCRGAGQPASSTACRTARRWCCPTSTCAPTRSIVDDDRRRRQQCSKVPASRRRGRSSLPKEVNDLDYDAITDVRLTFTYEGSIRPRPPRHGDPPSWPPARRRTSANDRCRCAGCIPTPSSRFYESGDPRRSPWRPPTSRRRRRNPKITGLSLMCRHDAAGTGRRHRAARHRARHAADHRDDRRRRHRCRGRSGRRRRRERARATGRSSCVAADNPSWVTDGVLGARRDRQHRRSCSATRSRREAERRTVSLDVGFAAQTPSLPGAGSAAGGLGETFAPDLSTGTGHVHRPARPAERSERHRTEARAAVRHRRRRTDRSDWDGRCRSRGWSAARCAAGRATTTTTPSCSRARDPCCGTPSGGWRPEVDTGDWRVARRGFGRRRIRRDRPRGDALRPGDHRRQPHRRSPPGSPWSWLAASQVEDNLGAHRNASRGAPRARSAISKRSTTACTASPSRTNRAPTASAWTRGGFVCATDERCATIELRIPDATRPRWCGAGNLAMRRSEPSGASLLSTVTMTGVAADGTELSTPPLTMRYTTPTAPRLVRIAARDAGSAPPAFDGRGRVELIDWDGDGVADVLEIGTGGDARVWANLGGAWDRPRTVANLPQLAATPPAPGWSTSTATAAPTRCASTCRRRATSPADAMDFGRPVQWSRAPSVPLGAPTTRLGRPRRRRRRRPGVEHRARRSCSRIRTRPAAGKSDRRSSRARPDGPPTDLTDPARVPRRHDR